MWNGMRFGEYSGRTRVAGDISMLVGEEGEILGLEV